MARLYEGVEEIPFKKIDGGYVFQANNAWLFGPKRRFFVTESQKAEIAGCIRETMRRIKPFVFVAMVLIPLLLIGGTFWFALRGGTLVVMGLGAALALAGNAINFIKGLLAYRPIDSMETVLFGIATSIIGMIYPSWLHHP